MKQTRRQKMISLLEEDPWTLKELAKFLSVEPQVVTEDLKHISQNKNYRLIMSPASCNSCDFVFHKRTKYRKPSRCPKCKSERISEGTISL